MEKQLIKIINYLDYAIDYFQTTFIFEALKLESVDFWENKNYDTGETKLRIKIAFDGKGCFEDIDEDKVYNCWRFDIEWKDLDQKEPFNNEKFKQELNKFYRSILKKLIKVRRKNDNKILQLQKENHKLDQVKIDDNLKEELLRELMEEELKMLAGEDDDE